MIMAKSILTVKGWQPKNAIAPLIYKRNCKPCIAPCEKKREISMISAPEGKPVARYLSTYGYFITENDSMKQTAI